MSSGEFFGFATKKNMEKPWFLVRERDESHIITGKPLARCIFFSGSVVTHSAGGPGARSDHKF